MTMASTNRKETNLVIGGAGFLGSYIVQALVDREENVAVYDLAKPSAADTIPGVQYFCGDILDETQLLDCLKTTGATTVFHTVSPVHGLDEAVYYRVNVEGTGTILSACKTVGVKIFIFTSSVSVVWTKADISGATEDDLPVAGTAYGGYVHSKGVAEQMVLQANGVNGMKVAALRPCPMFGPRDRQAMWKFAESYRKGQTKVQLGSNKNLVDFSYAGNVADAHILAADRLAEVIASPTLPDRVSGQAFFISDGKPRLYWTCVRTVFQMLGDDPNGPITIIPRVLALILAFFAELWASIAGGKPMLTMFVVDVATRERYYNIDKARTLLGYEPRVPLDEGLRRMVEWWRERGAQEYDERMQPRKKI